MKIAVAGGRETADYLTGLLRAAGHKVAVIQEDRAFCEHLSAKYDMSVTCGDPCREDVLADAGIRGCGLFLRCCLRTPTIWRCVRWPSGCLRPKRLPVWSGIRPMWGFLKAWAWIMPSARRGFWPHTPGRADRPGRHLLEGNILYVS